MAKGSKLKGRGRGKPVQDHSYGGAPPANRAGMARMMTRASLGGMSPRSAKGGKRGK
jgi:hypothetical protein